MSDTEMYGIDTQILIWHSGIRRLFRGFYNVLFKINPWDRYCSLVTHYTVRMLAKELIDMKKSGYTPDVVSMEWTQTGLMIDLVNRIYPNVPCIITEHDIMSQSATRKMEIETNELKRRYKRIARDNIQKNETRILNKCDLIVTLNKKDDKILENMGFDKEKRFVLSPFFHRTKLERVQQHNKDIVFYGNMEREENQTAVVWFINNVMPNIDDLECKFVIVGSHPPEYIKKMENQKIRVLGYVEEIDEIFSKSLCFVAPLLIGAGIKIKVLEALYSGIPVLTNDIGIEGIGAEQNRDYIHCISPEDYSSAIRRLLTDKDAEEKLQGQEFVTENYTLDASFDDYKERIKVLLSNNRMKRGNF